jgi:catalase (peroxidase I)
LTTAASAATRADPVFGTRSRLGAVGDGYGSEDAADEPVRELTETSERVATLGRFDRG